MLPACHVKSWPQIGKLSEALYDSGLKNIAVNFLVDGTFGTNPAIIKAVIDKLCSGGRTLWLEFYFVSGPTMRKFKDTKSKGFCCKIDPKKFRLLIQTDSNLRRAYQEQVVMPWVDLIRYNQEKGGFTAIVPSLEDNLDSGSHASLLALTKAAIPSDLVVFWGRNPCNCYPGSNTAIPPADFSEKHVHKGSEMSSMLGIYTTDGYTYLHPGEKTKYPRSVKLADLKAVQKEAERKQSWFLLWNAKYQGLTDKTPDPETRLYAVPTASELAALVQFWRS